MIDVHAFGHHQAGAAGEATRVVISMDVVRHSILAGAYSHRRHDDAVLET